MKKTLLALAALAMGLSVNAQLYITGDFGANAWDPENAYEMTQSGNVYTIDAMGATQIKLSKVRGDWDTFNTEGIGCPDQLQNNVAAHLEYPWGENTMLPWKGDYKITVDLGAMTILVSTNTPAPTGFTPVYLRGDMNDWAADPAWQMTTNDGTNYVFSGLIPANKGFKIADANWGAINYGGAYVLDPGQEYVLDKGGMNNNLTFAADYQGTLRFNVKTAILVVDALGGVENVAVDANVAPVYYNLAGVRVANPVDGELYIVRRGANVAKEIR